MDHSSQTSPRPLLELASGEDDGRIGKTPLPPLIPPAAVNTPAFRAELARRVRMYHEDMERDRAQLFLELRRAVFVGGAVMAVSAIAVALGALRWPF